jgi:hypothetical protein
MVFEYISGEETDANSRQRWSRVEAETETVVLSMGNRDAYALRPGFILPMRGVKILLYSLARIVAVGFRVIPDTWARESGRAVPDPARSRLRRTPPRAGPAKS